MSTKSISSVPEGVTLRLRMFHVKWIPYRTTKICFMIMVRGVPPSYHIRLKVTMQNVIMRNVRPCEVLVPAGKSLLQYPYFVRIYCTGISSRCISPCASSGRLGSAHRLSRIETIRSQLSYNESFDRYPNDSFATDV